MKAKIVLLALSLVVLVAFVSTSSTPAGPFTWHATVPTVLLAGFPVPNITLAHWRLTSGITVQQLDWDSTQPPSGSNADGSCVTPPLVRVTDGTHTVSLVIPTGN